MIIKQLLESRPRAKKYLELGQLLRCQLSKSWPLYAHRGAGIKLASNSVKKNFYRVTSLRIEVSSNIKNLYSFNITSKTFMTFSTEVEQFL